MATVKGKAAVKPRATRRAAKVPALTITVNDGGCGDGCGSEVAKGRTFRQGHDAKLHSALNTAYRAGEREYGIRSEGTLTVRTMEARYIESNWEFPPAAKARKARKARKLAA